MIRSMTRFSCLVAVLVIAQVALAQQFSADVVNTRPNNELKKVYAGKDKIRFEVKGNSNMGQMAVILDESQRTFVLLMMDRHMYMDAPPMVTGPLMNDFWRVTDVDDACTQWKQLAEQIRTKTDANKNWSCTKIGSDTVNGRSTVKYEGVSDKGEKNHFWVDTKLHCVVKTDNSNGIELRNIQEGAQPASLFEIPAGFTKMDMGAMMQQRR